jgi:outer membrane protein OmpA-like peptidoglycan-associated protein
MRNRVLLAAATLAIAPTLLFAQQRPAQPPARRPAAPPQRPAAQPAPRPMMMMGTAEQKGAWRLSIAPTVFIERDKALFDLLYRGVARGKAPDRYLPGGLVGAGYHVTDNIAVGVSGGVGFTAGLTLLQGQVGGLYSFMPSQTLSPYIGLGVGGSSFSGNGNPSSASGIGGYGTGGLRYFVKDNLAVHVEGRVGMEHYSSTSITSSINAIVGSAGVGLTYFTGRKILTTIAVNPGAPTLSSLQQTQQLTATANDQHGKPMTGRVLRWTSSNPAVATVSATGLVTAVGDGHATISAASEGVTGTASVTVAQAAASVALSPATATLEALGATQQLTAAARDANNNAFPGAVFTWTSSDAAVATVSASGMVTSTGNGTARITATSGGKSASASITVAQTTASVAVTPAASTISRIGGTAQLTAQAMDANGSPISGKTFTWTSDAAGVATVSGTGMATSVANGVAHITASADGKTGSATVTVVPIALPAVNATMVLNNVTFRSGSAVVLAAARAELDKVAIAIKAAPNSRWELGGYTNSVGAAAANQRLSLRRANAIKAYLVTKGVPAASLTAVGYGENNPIASNRTAAGRRQNMRVEIKRLQ